MKILKLYSNTEEYYDIKRRLNKPKWTKAVSASVNFVIGSMIKDISAELMDVCAIDTHIHTEYSHCCFEPIEVTLRRAALIGLSGVCIMDHHTIEGYKKALEVKEKLVSEGVMKENFIIVPGIEYSSCEGHIGGMFCEKDIYFRKYTAKETVDMIHDMGGVAVCVHPYRKKTGIKDIFRDLPFDCVEERAGSVFSRKYASLNYEMTKDFPFAKLGSSDAHYWSFIGSCYTVFPKECKTGEDVRDVIIRRETLAKESVNIKIIRKLLGN